MCDFRKITAVVIDGEEVPVDTIRVDGHIDFTSRPGLTGIYHIGATGCGLYYWDGDMWKADYYYQDDPRYIEYKTDGYTFILADTIE
jgi:hypothetical protein